MFQDPREALILTLKNTVNNLEQENDYLRSMLRMFSAADIQSSKPRTFFASKQEIKISKF